MLEERIKMNKNNIFKIEYIVVAIGAILSTSECFLEVFNRDTSITYIYIAQLFFFFFVSYISTIRRAGVLHIFSLLHLTTFVFAFGGILVTPFTDVVSFRESHSPLPMTFTENVVQKIIILYTVYVCTTYLFYWGLIDYKELGRKGLCKLETNEKYLKLAKYTMLITLPFAIYYSILQFQIVAAEGGRTALYAAGGNDAIGVPIYVRIPNMFFTASFYILIASCPPKKDFIKYLLIYFITLVPILLMGERGEVIVPIIFTLWYMKSNYNIKINYVKLGALALAIMAVAYIITFTRLGDDVGELSTLIIITGFLGTSATSFSLLGYYITYKDQIMPHSYPFVFDSFLGGMTGYSGQSLETLEHRASIGHHLVYTLNPNYYLSGASTGTSYLTECYEFGLFGVILGAFVLALFMIFIDYKMRKSYYMMVFLFLLFSNIILSPRGSLFLGIYDIIKYSLILLVLTWVYTIIHKKKNISD